jgi:hypothetical protein
MALSARITVRDGEPPFIVENVAQLDDVLRDAGNEAQAQRMLAAIIIEAENKNFITMVVGGPDTVLGFDYADGRSPSYASKGSSNEQEPMMTCYLAFRHHTEFPHKYVVPLKSGIEAARQFLDSGDLPTCIDWEVV